MVDNNFDSSYLTLTRAFERHRISARYGSFDLLRFNDPIGITNQDIGHAFAVTWLFHFNPRLRIGTEYMQIKSDHCATDTCFWIFNGLPRQTKESQVQVSMRWYFKGAGHAFR